MNQTLTRLALIAAITALPLGASAGVTGTHGPDRGSGGAVVAKPKPVAAEEQTSEQTAKPEEKKEVEVTKDAK